MAKLHFVTLALSFATACAGAAGTQPHDMSAPQHQRAADAADLEAESAQAAPASTGEARCSPGKLGLRRACWTSRANPSALDEQQASMYRKLAAEHRAASQALREAEDRECAGLEEEDRLESPFSHFDDLGSVTELHGDIPIAGGKTKTTRRIGATVVVNAVPGLTLELLQRMVSCHLARNAAAGHEMPEMPYCPLVPSGAAAKVRSVGTGFAVDISAPNSDVATEIWRRASALKQRS